MPRHREPLVSAIIPTLDRPVQLAAAMSSVLGQDYRAIELIVVDDGSGPETQRVINAAVQSDERVRSVRSETPRGPAAARNAGASEAGGTFLLFEDDDCTGEPERVRSLVCALEETPHAGYAYCHGLDTGTHGRTVVSGTEGPWAIGTPAALIRADIFRAVGGFDPNLPRLVDFDLWTRILARHRAVEVSEVLFHTVRDKEGVSASSDNLVRASRYLMRKYETSDLPAPHLARMHRYLGGALVIRGHRGQALSHFARAVRLDPPEPRGWLALFAGLSGARGYRAALQLMARFTSTGTERGEWRM